MNFLVFKNAVAKQFERLRKNDMFRTDVEKDDLWKTYIGSFPVGSDPILKARSEHDCNCCKQFIRAIGNCVAVIDGKLESIWDIDVSDKEPHYQVVADALSALVKSKAIKDEFLHIERVAGTEKTYSQVVDGGVTTWNHFHVHIPFGANGDKNFVTKGEDVGTRLNKSRTAKEVFKRGLDELALDDIDTVLELIQQDSLYRGAEFKWMVEAFRTEKIAYNKIPQANRDSYVWLRSKAVSPVVADFRGSMIGSLVVDLSKGVELEDSVKMYESKAAPANYKRPTALVTKAMIDNAKKKIVELGLVSALERRYATLEDININDILFADRSAKKAITGDVFSEIADKVTSKVKNLDKVEEVSIEKFLSDILPKAESLEVMLENRHNGNLVSLIAPVDPTANGMFKWNNQFSWSYNGDMADSMKERVKQAGGNVTGDLCCRLAWEDKNDLDFHIYEPSGYHLYFGNRSTKSVSGGLLDVDANGGSGPMLHPVENIFYSNKATMQEGVYKLVVHQFNRRVTTDVGFDAEIDFMGTVYHFHYDKPVKAGEQVTVAEFNYSKKDGLTIIKSLPSTQSSKDVWNMATQTFQKVNVLMMSPNYWGGQGVGNKHYFFMLDGCQNEGKARGFFNEFLKPELDVHRKVIEMVGSKMKTEESSNQLSGIGFSSTQRNSLLCRVKGTFTRTLKIVF